MSPHEDGTSIVVVVRDVTDKKRTQARLIEALDRAEFFVDLMGHDLSNINQAISGSLELALYEDVYPPVVREMVFDALDHVLRSATLISNVKKLTQLESNPPKEKLIALDAVVEDALESVSKSMPLKKIHLHGIAELKGHRLVLDDYIRDVFFNLFHNAAKYTHTDDVRIDISSELTDEDEFIQISVADYGKGVSDKEKELLFQRINMKKEGYWGSGIGLTLSKRIIDHYGGDIWVEDRVRGDASKGAKFVVKLPLNS